MRKIIISLLAVSMMIVPVFAQTQSVRTASMNLGADDVEDIGNIISFPQLISQYTNRVWYNNVTADYEQTILTCDLSSYVVGMGLYKNVSPNINNPSPIANDFLGVGATGLENAQTIYPDSILNIGFAGELGGGEFGALVLVNMASDVDTPKYTNFVPDPDTVDEGVTRDEGASYYGVVVGYGLEEVGPLARLDVSAGIGLIGFSTEWVDVLTSTEKLATPNKAPDMETWEKDAGMDLEIQAQGIMELDDATSLRLTAAYNTSSITAISTDSRDLDDDGSYTTATGGDQNDIYERGNSNSTISLSAVMNKDVNDGGLLVVGAGLSLEGSQSTYLDSTFSDPDGNAVYAQETTQDDENNWSDIRIPVVIAVEDEIRENITLRVGARKSILVKSGFNQTDQNMGMVDGAYGVANENADENTELDSEDVETSLGIGAVLGNFTINAAITTDMLFNGPYWITGDVSNLATAIDIIYPF